MVPAPNTLIAGETGTVSAHPGEALVAEGVGHVPLEELDSKVRRRKNFGSM